WAAPDERFARGVLWRVSKKGVAPSHVFGTIHVADPRLAELPPAVCRAFGGAKSLMLEFMPDAYSKERFLQAALFLDHQTLEQKIGTEDFQRAVDHLQPIGLSREFVNRLKPWGVLLNLRSAAGKDGSLLDVQLLALARARRIPLLQIEQVEEQIFTFDEFPMESQVALLKHSLNHRDELAALAERQAVMTKRVVHDRSVVMAFRMQRELRRGAAFVALGALHLYGDKGVLALLEGDGYRSTRVY